MRVLVAGMGNLLRGDDGFGVEVAKLLSSRVLPQGTTVIEVGIGGIHLVQDLLEATDGLIVIDAVDIGRSPGTVVVMEPDVEDVRSLDLERRRDMLADMHYANPSRALMLARALDVLPDRLLLVGCQVLDGDAVGEGLSEVVSAALPAAVEAVEGILASWHEGEGG